MVFAVQENTNFARINGYIHVIDVDFSIDNVSSLIIIRMLVNVVRHVLLWEILSALLEVLTGIEHFVSQRERERERVGKGDNVASKNHEMEKIKREEEDNGRGRAWD